MKLHHTFKIKNKKGDKHMAKQKRGKVLKSQKNWRGTCPICNRKRVKLAWLESSAKGAKNICKACHARINKA